MSFEERFVFSTTNKFLILLVQIIASETRIFRTQNISFKLRDPFELNVTNTPFARNASPSGIFNFYAYFLVFHLTKALFPDDFVGHIGNKIILAAPKWGVILWNRCTTWPPGVVLPGLSPLRSSTNQQHLPDSALRAAAPHSPKILPVCSCRTPVSDIVDNCFTVGYELMQKLRFLSSPRVM